VAVAARRHPGPAGGRPGVLTGGRSTVYRALERANVPNPH